MPQRIVPISMILILEMVITVAQAIIFPKIIASLSKLAKQIDDPFFLEFFFHEQTMVGLQWFCE